MLMTMKKLTALLATGMLVASLSAADTRKWTDQKGKQIQAEMTGMRDGKVLLKLSNGKVAPVPLSILSEEDQEYIRNHAPMDLSAASRTIDKMVLNKLKASYQGIVQELEKTKRTPVSASFPVKDKIKKVEDLEYVKRMTYEQLDDPLTDEQFVRRIYLDVAGRIPTYTETVEFLDGRERDKRSKLIDELLDSEAFTSHFFNYMSDLLRIRDGISMNGLNGLKAEAYMDWSKDQIRNNRPWDEWVSDMVAAEGFYWDNPATGYLLTDQGMPLCNLSNTFTVFTGTEITCAQCHDHPFEEIYQMDFYRLAAFFGGTNLRAGGSTEEGSMAMRKLKELQAEWRKRHAGKKPMPRFPRQVQDTLNAHRYYVKDTSKPMVKLPHDYKYDDADPFNPVYPAAYFGERVELDEHESARHAFATWLTSKENPRFTINIVNRLWQFAFGLAQIEPVYNIPGHLSGQAQNYELLKYLEELMHELDYDIKAFLRVLYNTKTYQREANRVSPTLAQVAQGEYHFPAPVLRRMSAEQMWDSLVALTTNQPEAARSRTLEQYRKLMHSNWSSMNLEQAKMTANRIRSLGAVQVGNGSKGDAEMSSMTEMKGSYGRNKNGQLDDLVIRASERRLPDRGNLLLSSFGQSDKMIIEGGHKMGSIPQVMFLLNGKLTNQMISRPDSAVMRNAREAGAQSDGVDVVYLSILNRRPRSEEARTAMSLVEGDDYTDLIWALLNSREFMFIQ